MSVFYAPETAMAKELRKWEYGNPDDGYRGYREVVTTEFPKMLYKFAQTDEGIVCVDRAEAANADGQRNLESRGFFVDQRAAVIAVEDNNREIARLAAERHYHERSMSDRAQREIAAHEAETDRHLPEIPETPIRRGGRPPKE